MLKRALSICQSQHQHQHQHHSGLCCCGLVAWVTGKTLLAGRGAPGRRCMAVSQFLTVPPDPMPWTPNTANRSNRPWPKPSSECISPDAGGGYGGMAREPWPACLPAP